MRGLGAKEAGPTTTQPLNAGACAAGGAPGRGRPLPFQCHPRLGAARVSRPRRWLQ